VAKVCTEGLKKGSPPVTNLKKDLPSLKKSEETKLLTVQRGGEAPVTKD